jgi:hypothetical protein
VPRQIVAWSDPSDLCSWNVSELETVVSAESVREECDSRFGFLKGRRAAHGNYDANKNVIRVMRKLAEHSQTNPGSNRRFDATCEIILDK